MKRFWLIAVPFVAALSLAAVPAFAGSIDFGSNGQASGAVEYNGKGGPAVGTGIPITSVSFGNHSDPVNGMKCGPKGHTFACGQLAFTTGNFITAGVNGFGQKFDEFAGGGTITLTGLVPGSGKKLTTLLTATFNGPVTFTQTTPTTLVMTANISVTSISPAVLALFPGVTVGPNGSLTVTMAGRIFKNNGLNGHIINTNLSIQTTPEPSALLMLGSGLAGLFGMRRRLKA